MLSLAAHHVRLADLPVHYQGEESAGEAPFISGTGAMPVPTAVELRLPEGVSSIIHRGLTGLITLDRLPFLLDAQVFCS